MAEDQDSTASFRTDSENDDLANSNFVGHSTSGSDFSQPGIQPIDLSDPMMSSVECTEFNSNHAGAVMRSDSNDSNRVVHKQCSDDTDKTSTHSAQLEVGEQGVNLPSRYRGNPLETTGQGQLLSQAQQKAAEGFSARGRSWESMPPSFKAEQPGQGASQVSARREPAREETQRTPVCDEQDSLARYQTIVACTPQLMSTLSLDPVTVSGHLLAKGLIPNSIHNHVAHSIETQHDKAKKLLIAITDSVKANTSNFDTLLSVLESWAKSTMTSLVSTYTKKRSLLQRSLMVRSTPRFSTKLSFVKPVQVLQVSSTGGLYCDDSLGLCVDVPKGTVPEGLLLELEIGMCLHGPFKFPGGSTPIAPILMLCPENDIQLNNSLRITLPHVIEDSDDSDIEALGIELIKADHSSLLSTTAGECIFDRVLKDANPHFHTHNGWDLVTFSLSHFCFVSLRATSDSEVIAKKKGYCICPLLPQIIDSTLTFYLCVTYFMAPCLEAIKKQFLSEKYELNKSGIKKFSLKGEKSYIQAKLGRVESGWVVSLNSPDENGIQVVDADSINLWTKEEDELKLEINNLMYPPSFQVTAIGQKATAPSFAAVNFTTHDSMHDYKFSIALRLPLQCESPTTQDASPPPNEQDSPEYQTMMTCTPQLTSALVSDSVTVGEHLFAKGLISEHVYDDLLFSSNLPRDKARRLVATMTTRVKTKSSFFDTFISVLKDQGDWTDDIVSILINRRASYSTR